MNAVKVVAITAALCVLTGSAAFADMQLTIQNGRVSLKAKDATVRQILGEWARIGQTKIVNLERIPGGPVTLELTDVSEAEALDILLRSVSGYMAAPRAAAVANLSQFDRIVVMPTSAAPRPPLAAAPPPTPTFPQPPFAQPQPVVDDDQDAARPATNGVGPAQNRGPVFNTFPQPQVVNPQTIPVTTPQPGVAQPANVFPGAPSPVQQQPQTPMAYPTAPFGGVAVPGMVAPTPQQPGQQPGQIVPGQPPQRRPGGQ